FARREKSMCIGELHAGVNHTREIAFRYRHSAVGFHAALQWRVDLPPLRRLNGLHPHRSGRDLTMSSPQRPLAPRLQIDSWHLTSVLSILHRITGIALSVGTLLLVYWIIAAAAGQEAFAAAQEFMGSILGRLLLFGWTLAFFYHLANGIRHLVWD